MSAPVRRGGHFPDDAGRTVTWSIADGRRGRRWRWTVVDRRGTLVAAHTLETDPAGRFVRLESAAPAGLLTLHAEPDGGIHGNRVAERGIDHLSIEAPVPAAILVGRTSLGVAILIGALTAPAARTVLDVVEVFDDLGVRIASATIRAGDDGGWEVQTNRLTRRAVLDADGLPGSVEHDAESWPLENP